MERKMSKEATVPEPFESGKEFQDDQGQKASRNDSFRRNEGQGCRVEYLQNQGPNMVSGQQTPGHELLHTRQREYSEKMSTNKHEGRFLRTGYPQNQSAAYSHSSVNQIDMADAGQGSFHFTQQLSAPVGGNGQPQEPLHTQGLLPFEQQQLPEPALTAALPKQRATGMPAIDKEEISSLLATTEQYLSVLRLNQNMHASHTQGLPTVPAYPSRSAKDNSAADINHLTALPSINSSHEFEYDLGKLPGVTKQLLAEVEAKKAAYRNRLRALRTLQGDRIIVSQSTQVMNTKLLPRSSGVMSSRATPQGIAGTRGRILKTTPKTLRPGRLVIRGPSNGYCSFGDLVQADMPSPSLEHFSITRLSRTAQRHNQTPPRPREKQFAVFWELLKRPELVITLASHLRVQELLILYRICKPFHNIINERFTTVILSQAMQRAPESAKIFPFRCYSKLCIDDPGHRPHPVAKRAAAGQHRKVPSFRWLLMVCYREMVCHDIRMIMAEDGIPLPEQCETVMKKIWFILDIPNNSRRIGMVQNIEIFTDTDLFFATLFFVKMDMRFTDPVSGSGRDGMRRMLLSQPTLSTFWKALKRTALVSKLDAVKMFIRWKWQPPARIAGQSVFGVPPEEIGILQFEGWGHAGNRVRLQRPDEIILKESIRRRLNLQRNYTDMFLWGYVNPRTLEDIPPIVERRDLDRLEGMEELFISEDDNLNRSIGKPVSTRVTFS
ncbi:hypothetical protein LOZ12_000298 [Ophidiomyces ophidiicola]|uniref:Uncharacterized protein n=1 Tax=Ophidiomyces ophidiicola TaxID=1387563 RepID=A0ACB8V5Y0_9EURO|nr:uncharacterized protein LOZ57_000751 [Ophidiomyces ophidiicola]KAI1944766.1 hypothetical protein LOZ62_004044 [Ophidiomyces ophidiicola]KAI1952672.1 hypothetical protein LOZ57_000751 [Ophidiomyces ophidiicola]KAI1975863.1 hypothetical protein LOZ56_000455 [Ophidiomyces ophidiicola]KAI2012091.1 hypothetical protein LOZ50_000413 [Ophidiomyces ophidiicola]KAI2026574.1 hypothetical protein LOZ45_003002 [Ophidiomyces ophidiicola]